MSRRRIALVLSFAPLGVACHDDGAAAAADAGTTSAVDTSADATTTAVAPATDDTGPGDSSSDAGNQTGTDASESSTGDPAVPPEPWVWDLPEDFPEPYVPPDNPMSAAKVELGRHLFYDTRLSVDGTFSCGTCHRQDLAFTDGLARSVGVTDEQHSRGSMSLVNVAYAASLTWADPTLIDLEAQVRTPLFGTSPVEMGLVDESDAMARIADEPLYPDMFAAAFPDDAEPMSFDNLAKAIAAFERTIISGNSPFDHWVFGMDESAVSESVKRGWTFFNGAGECNYCHFSFNWSDSTYFPALPERTIKFHNTGLYDLDGAGAYPEDNQGLFAHTGDPADMGKFRSPTLRFIGLTGPYMHDGSITTLDAMLDAYGEIGGRAHSPLADPQLDGVTFTAQQRADLLALFESLTEDELLTDPALSDPW